ncbi:DUF4307 domain-containing protein [Nocardioides sp. SYSU D00038]|uniref:DUF4307 domain-containing protein n=1 Tax=Nocardioides sp. SYSU D00038 TaxID=2812554 RepID=UPI0019687D12|nr:DUF4307 domain-containing protein [Nocardioides sp. SYSU D00038]
MSAQDTLAERYGAPAPWRRRALLLVAAAVVAAFLGWLAWTAWGHGTPEVTSELETWTIEGEHAAVAVVVVSLRDDDVEATCRLRALAEDHSTVGEVSFTPDPGTRRQTQQIRTERRATAVESLGCTTADQKQPR